MNETKHEGTVKGPVKDVSQVDRDTYKLYDPNRIASHLFSLVDAVGDLVTASSDLVLRHIELARLELKEDIVGLVNRAVLFGAIVMMLFFGYCLLLITTILLIGWAWGVPGMALASFVLAIVHLGVAIPQVVRLATRIRKPAEFKRSRKEMENTKTWMSKQITNSNLRRRELVKEPLENQSAKS